jgi:uncharacterized protein YjbI with pentapeptide repeats
VLWLIGIVAAATVGYQIYAGRGLSPVLVAFIGLAIFIILIRLSYRRAWTGFGEDVRPEPEGQDVRRAKTLWDWMQLLFVPVVIAIGAAVGGTWFTEQRTQEDALQSYFDQMGHLLLEEDLNSAQASEEAHALARARTLTVLERLDPNRKKNVVQFLYEADLISGKDPIIDLAGANLREADLSFIPILDGVNLRRADLEDANLNQTNLRDADLSGARLEGAILVGDDLSGANLSEAILIGADLSHSNIQEADLGRADLSGAYLRFAEGLTQEQIEQAAWDQRTEFPPDITPPKEKNWSNKSKPSEPQPFRPS